MPSWNEKPVTVPTINVNLTPCGPPCLVPSWSGTRPLAHFENCPGAPVLIPCPIPGSFTAEVRLGECQCLPGFHAGARGAADHLPVCPARPVRVSCSIGGDGTWAGSEVTECSDEREDYYPQDADDLLRLARARWEIVKALVKGKYTTPDMASTPNAMTVQRDAVFGALADMARAEDAHAEAGNRAAKAIGIAGGGRDDGRATPQFLALYVERLVEQVRVLP